MAAIANERGEAAAKEARIAAVEDLGWGICWDCEVARLAHCREGVCKRSWCPSCNDW
ncbi:hypothetical protein [Streptomyces sp. bgisy060]|uniref:hypothetical protein n=1 Tax=Streptomyces sp. bgisy060 TaxID=3413775 RepID=UPI003EBFDC38